MLMQIKKPISGASLTDGKLSGLVLLDRDFQVIGMDSYVYEAFHPKIGMAGISIFDYHPEKSHEKIREFLKRHKSDQNFLIKKANDRIYSIKIITMVR